MISDLVIVITGPIGSGKSHVAGLFRQRGWQAVDADVIGHDVLREEELVSEIRERWPSAVTGSTVDRMRLADLVFADGSLLKELESLTHPRIQERITKWIEETAGGKVIEVSVPSAIREEWGLRLVVDASRKTRVARLIGRGMKPENIASRMEKQPSRNEWLAGADVVVENQSRGDRAIDHLISYLESR